MKTEILEALRNGVTTVKFTKVNGDERIMKCTLNFDIIPEEHTPKETIFTTNKVIRAFDVEKEGWRSFRIENVKEFT